MPSFLNNMMDFINSPTFGTLQIIVISYLGLLWLAIIIWVTRDSINRSKSIIFQTFSILINIAIPILGILLYLIIRPGKTNMERYYEELEHRMLIGDEDSGSTCENCMTVVDKDYAFCPKCGVKTKKTCIKCKKHFPSIWNICPYCGSKQDEEKTTEKQKIKKIKK